MNLVDIVNQDHLNPKAKDLPNFQSGNYLNVVTLSLKLKAILLLFHFLFRNRRNNS